MLADSCYLDTKMSKERFKVTIKDRISGEKITYNTHSAGYHFNSQHRNNKTEFVRITMEFPKVKIKENKNGRK
jgi:hypothetical protein